MVQLPRILILLLNLDLESWVGSYRNMEKSIEFIFGRIVCEIQKRKIKLGKKGSRTSEPKYLVIRSLPVANWVPGYKSKKSTRRVFDKSLENVGVKFDKFYITNVDEIKPDKPDLFNSSGTTLSAKGFEIY